MISRETMFVWVLILVSFASIQARAQDAYWQGNTQNWTESFNWIGGYPGPADTAVFGTPFETLVDLNGDQFIGGVRVEGFTNYTLGLFPSNFTLFLQGGFGPLVQVDAGSMLTMNSDIEMLGFGHWQIDGEMSMFGQINGGNDLIKSGFGGLDLYGDNSGFMQNIFVEDGMLRLMDANNVSMFSTVDVGNTALLEVFFSQQIGGLSGSGGVQLNNADLATGFNGQDQLFHGDISGTGSFTQTGPGLLTVVGNLFHFGDTTVDFGSRMQIGDGGNIGSVAGTITNNGELTFYRSDDIQVNQTIDGGGDLIKRGFGNLVFNTPQLYTGSTHIQEGRVVIDDSNALQNSTVIVDVSDGLDVTTNGVNATLGGLAGIGQLDIGIQVLTVGNNGENTQFSGNIDGVGGVLNKVGAGTLTLNNFNTYAGGTTIQGGTLTLNHPQAAGTGAITVLGSTIAYGNGVAINNSILLNTPTTHLRVDTGAALQEGAISETGGARSIRKVGTGQLDLMGVNTYSGTTFIIDGALGVQADNNLGASAAGLIMQGGTLSFNSDFTTGASRSVVIGVAGGTFESFGPNAGIGGVISSTGALTKTGPGTLTLGGTNTYSGGTVIQEGTLQITNAANLGNASGDVTFSGGTLQTSTSSITIRPHRFIGSPSGDLRFETNVATRLGDGSVLIGDADLVKTGASTLNVQALGSYTGATLIQEGRLDISLHSERLPNATSVVISENAVLRMFNGVTETIGSLEGAGDVLFSDANSNLKVGANNTSTVFDGQILQDFSGDGQFTKLGNGSLTLNGASDYTGGTTLSGGILHLGNSAAIGTGGLIVNAGVVSYANGVNIANPIDLQLELTQFRVDSGSATQTGVISGQDLGGLTAPDGLAFTLATRGIQKAGAGTLLLRGANTYDGQTAFVLGVLDVVSDTNLGAGGALNFDGGTLRYGAAFSLNGSRGVYLHPTGGTIDSNGFDATIGNFIDGPGALTKTGTGTLTLSGTNNYSGGTTISGGALKVSVPANLGAASSAINFNGGKLHIATTGGTFSQPILTSASADAIIEVDGGIWGVLNGSFSGDGGLVKMGDGFMILDGNNTFTGPSQILDGVVYLNGLGSEQFSASANLHINSGAALVFNNGTVVETVGSLSGDGAILLRDKLDHQLLVGGDDSNSAFSGRILADSGDGQLTKLGTGTLTLNGDSDYTGGTNLMKGALGLGHNNAAGTGGITIGDVNDPAGAPSLRYGDGVAIGNNLTFLVNSSLHVESGTATQAGVIDFTGGVGSSFIKTGAGTLVLTGVNSGSVTDVNINDGTLAVASPLNLPSGFYDIGNATFRFDGSFTLPDFYVYGNATFDTNGNDATVGYLYDAGVGYSVTKTGAGSLTLTGSNDYFGATRILQGDIILGASERIHNNSALEISGGASLRLQGSQLFETVASLSGSGDVHFGSGDTTLRVGGNNAPTIFDGRLLDGPSSNGHLDKVGTGTLTLGGNNTHAGNTSINDGTIALSNPKSLQKSHVILNALTNGLDVTTHGVDAILGGLGGGGNLDIGSQNITVGGNNVQAYYFGSISGAGGVTKTGNASWILGAANTFGGGINLTSGALHLRHSQAAGYGPITVTGGFLILGDQVQMSNDILLDKSLSIEVSSGHTSEVYGDILEITGPYGITKTGGGSLILSGGNNYSGGTTLSQGTVRIYEDVNLGAPSTPVNFAGGALEIVGPGIMSDRPFYIQAASTLRVNGSNEYTHSGAITADPGTEWYVEGAGTLNLLGEGMLARMVAFNNATINVDGSGGLGSYHLDSDSDELRAFDSSINVINGGLVELENSTGNFQRSSLTIDGSTFQGNPTLIEVNSTILVDNNGYFGAIGAPMTFRTGSSLTVRNGAIVDSFEISLQDNGPGTAVVTGEGTYLSALNLTMASNQSPGGMTVSFGARVDVSNRINLNATGSALIVDQATVYANRINAAPGSLIEISDAPPIVEFLGAGIGLGEASFNPSLVIGANGGASVIAAVISDNDGPGSIHKIGTGRLALGASNTFSGGILLEGGTLELGNDNAAGTGTITARQGVIEYVGGLTVVNPINLQNSVELSVPITTGTATQVGAIVQMGGPYGVTKTGGGGLRLVGVNSYLGGTTIREGILEISQDRNLGADPLEPVFVEGEIAPAMGPGQLNGEVTLEGGTLFVNQNHSTNREFFVTANSDLIAPSGYTITGPLFGVGAAELDLIAGTLVIGGANNHIARLASSAGGTHRIFDGGATVLTGAADVLSGIQNDVTVRNGAYVSLLNPSGVFAGGRLRVTDPTTLLEGGPTLFTNGAELIVENGGVFQNTEDVIFINNSSRLSISTGGRMDASGLSLVGADPLGADVVGPGSYLAVQALGLGEAGDGGQLLVRAGARVDVFQTVGIGYDTSRLAIDQATFAAKQLSSVFGSQIWISNPQSPIQTINSGPGAFEFQTNSALVLGGDTYASLIGSTITDLGVPGSIEKVGPSTLSLLAANTFTGGVILSGGELELGTPTAAGTGNIFVGVPQGVPDFNQVEVLTQPQPVVADLTISYTNGINVANQISLTVSVNLNVGGGGAATQAGSILESGFPSFVNKTGDGQLTFSAANTYAGGTTISGGTLVINNDGNLGASNRPVTLDGGTLEVTESHTTNRGFSIVQPSTLKIYGTGDHVIAGDVSGDLLRVEASGSPLRLTGTGSLPGIHFIASQVGLTLDGADYSFSSANPFVVPTLDVINASEVRVPSSQWALQGTQIRIAGYNTEFIGNPGVVSISASILVEDQAGMEASHAMSFDAGTSLTVRSGAGLFSSSPIHLGSPVFETGGSMNALVTGANSRLQATSMTLGAGPIDGHLLVAVGADVQIAGQTSLNTTGSSLIVEGGTFSTDTLIVPSHPTPLIQISDAVTITPLTGGDGPALVTTSIPALTIGTGNGSSTIQAPIADASEGAGSLKKEGSGTLTLEAGSTYSGGTHVVGGTLLANNTSDSATGLGAVHVNDGGTLGGNGSVSGAVVVNSGGTLAPGGLTPNTYAAGLIVGPTTLETGSMLDIQIAGTQASIDYDQLLIQGDAQLDGTLNLTLPGPYLPDPLYRFSIIHFENGLNSVTGDFDMITGQTAASPLLLIPDYVPENGPASASLDIVTAIPGDFNFNGQVNIADLIIWAQGFGGASTTFQTGDANLDTSTNLADLIVWAQHFGQTPASFLQPVSAPVLQATSAAVAIPEPSSLLLFGLGLLGVMRRKVSCRMSR